LTCWEFNRRINGVVFLQFIAKCVCPAYRKMYFPKLGPLLYSFFWVIPRRLNSEAGESPPQKRIHHSEHGEKSRTGGFTFEDAVLYHQFQLHL